MGNYHYDGQGGPHALSKVTHSLTNGPALPEFDVNWEWDGQEQLKPQNSLHNQDFSYDANGSVTQMGCFGISPKLCKDSKMKKLLVVAFISVLFGVCTLFSEFSAAAMSGGEFDLYSSMYCSLKVAALAFLVLGILVICEE